MVQALKAYDKSFAEGMLARTSFYLEDNPVLQALKPIDGEAKIRDAILSEVCSILNIASVVDNTQAVQDYLDDALEESTKLDKKAEKDVLARLSRKGELPTDLYTVKVQSSEIMFLNDLYKNERNFAVETIKRPDMVYNFADDYTASIFAKFYREKHEHNSFFLLVVGKREGLTFKVGQIWRLYSDMLTGGSFANALELLERFVEKFGVEAEHQGRTSKFFVDVLAKNQGEFKISLDNITRSKKGDGGILTCHFLGPSPNTGGTLSIFFAIDTEKYKEYITRHIRLRRHALDL